jgi:hypothetical protein
MLHLRSENSNNNFLSFEEKLVDKQLLACE